MKNRIKKIVLLAGLLAAASGAHAKEYGVTSPSGEIAVTVNVEAGALSYDVTYKGTQIVADAPLSMRFSNGVVAGRNVRVRSSRITEIDETLTPVVPQKRARIEDRYRQLEIKTGDRYSVLFRVYDDGMAYRIATEFTGPVRVEDEQVEYTFDRNAPIYCGLESSMFTHQEAHYQPMELSALRDSMIAAPPMIVTVGNGIRVLLTESDLERYAGMYYTSDGSGTVRALFPRYVTKTEQPRDRDIRPVERADYIAELAPLAAEVHSFLTDGKESLTVSPEKKYRGDEEELKGRLYEELKNNYDRDVRLGYTASGPHRDDVDIKIDGEDAKTYASQGQTRTAALAIKLAEVEIFKTAGGEYPVLILDDVLSELDLARRKKLVSRTAGLQTILTCTHAERVLGGREATKIRIEGGAVKR